MGTHKNIHFSNMIEILEIEEWRTVTSLPRKIREVLYISSVVFFF